MAMRKPNDGPGPGPGPASRKPGDGPNPGRRRCVVKVADGLDVEDGDETYAEWNARLFSRGRIYQHDPYDGNGPDEFYDAANAADV